MGQGMNKILPGLYLGSIRDSEDKKQIEENKITHILSIHENAANGSFEGVKYRCVKARDYEKENLSVHFSHCIEFIHKARVEGGNVLVHCMAGVSRSATITIAYVMTVTELSYNDALKAVKGSRRQANPNEGFLEQLLEFEIKTLKYEKENLISKFGDLKNDDHEYCKDLISLYHEAEERLTRQRDKIRDWNHQMEEKFKEENKNEKEEVVKSEN